MAKGTVNKVVLIGRLGLDPEIRYMPGGAAVARISLATNESYKDKTGQAVERTEWHRISFMGRLAEIVGEFARKGSLLYVEGRIHTRKWKDNSGVERYITEISGYEMQFLGGRGEGGGGSTVPYQNEAGAPQQKNKTSAPNAPKPAVEYPEDLMPSSEVLSPVPEMHDLMVDDDIPF